MVSPLFEQPGVHDNREGLSPEEPIEVFSDMDLAELVRIFNEKRSWLKAGEPSPNPFSDSLQSWNRKWMMGVQEVVKAAKSGAKQMVNLAQFVRPALYFRIDGDERCFLLSATGLLRKPIKDFEIPHDQGLTRWDMGQIRGARIMNRRHRTKKIPEVNKTVMEIIQNGGGVFSAGEIEYRISVYEKNQPG